jgi:GcrA cell cycle regulator
VAIGKLLRVSKGAVVGKAYRLELTTRHSPIMRDKKAGTRTKKVRSLFTMADLTAQTCRWPSGDPKHKDFQFCGRPAEPGKPYCTPHCELGYVAIKPKRAA